MLVVHYPHNGFVAVYAFYNKLYTDDYDNSQNFLLFIFTPSLFYAFLPAFKYPYDTSYRGAFLSPDHPRRLTVYRRLLLSPLSSTMQ